MSEPVFDENGWATIDSAPRDGSYILACHFVNFGPFSTRWVNGGWFEDVDEEDDHQTFPTHWRPLPMPPVTS